MRDYTKKNLVTLGYLWIICRIILIICVFCILILYVFYARILDKENAWSNVDKVYEQRLILIPNLVETVQSVDNFDKGTLETVAIARAKAASIEVDILHSWPSEKSLANFQEAQDQLSCALSRLFVTCERYPKLQSNMKFIEQKALLEGTESTIAVERSNFNSAVNEYNAYIRKPFIHFIARIFNDEEISCFKDTEGAENPPHVDSTSTVLSMKPNSAMVSASLQL